MADPTPYTPDYSFDGFQSTNPTTPLPGQRLDDELLRISERMNELVDAVKDVRRSDGAIQNGSVHAESLGPGISTPIGVIPEGSIGRDELDDNLLATQPQAEAGASNDVLMTPLRTAQYLDAISSASGLALLAAATVYDQAALLTVRPRFATLAALQAAVVPASVTQVEIDEYATGTGVRAIWRFVASEPTHALKAQTSNSRWFELYPWQALDARMAGLVYNSSGAGVANATAMNRMIAYVSAMLAGGFIVAKGSGPIWIGDNSTTNTCICARSNVVVSHQPGVVYNNRALGRTSPASTHLAFASLAAQASLLQIDGAENGAINNFHWLGMPLIDGGNAAPARRGVNIFGQVNGLKVWAESTNQTDMLLTVGDLDELDNRGTFGQDWELALRHTGTIITTTQVVNVFPRYIRPDGRPALRNVTVKGVTFLDATNGVASDLSHAVDGFKISNTENLYFEPGCSGRGGQVACFNITNGCRHVTGALKTADCLVGVWISNSVNFIAIETGGFIDLKTQHSGDMLGNLLAGVRIQGNQAGVVVEMDNQNGGVSFSESDGERFAVTFDPIPSATVTISTASPAVVTWTGHGRAANTPVKFTTSGALHAQLVPGRVYFIKTVLDANTFTVSATKGGAAINTSGSQSGTHTCSCVVTHSETVTTAGPAATATMTIASPCVVTWTANGRPTGQPIKFTTTGALPTGVTAGTTYFIATVIDANTFTISATVGGADIVTTGSQSGTHTITCVTEGTIHGWSATHLVLTRHLMVGMNTLTAGATFSISGGAITGTVGTVDAVDGGSARVTGYCRGGRLDVETPSPVPAAPLRPLRQVYVDLTIDGLLHNTRSASKTGGETIFSTPGASNYWMEDSDITLRFVNPPVLPLTVYGKDNRVAVETDGVGAVVGTSAIVTDYGIGTTIRRIVAPATQLRHQYFLNRGAGSSGTVIQELRGPFAAGAGVALNIQARTASQPPARGNRVISVPIIDLNAAAVTHFLEWIDSASRRGLFIVGWEEIYPAGSSADAGVALQLGVSSSLTSQLDLTSIVSASTPQARLIGQTVDTVSASLLNEIAIASGVLTVRCAGGKTGVNFVKINLHVVDVTAPT